MKKEIFLTILILSLIIILDIVLSKNIDNKIDFISSKLEHLQENMDLEDEENIKKEFEFIDSEWKKTEEIFSFYLEHDELEKVGVEMSNIKESIETGEFNETKTDINRLQFILEHLKDKMDFKLKNVF